MRLHGHRGQGGRLGRKGEGGEQKTGAGAGGKAGRVINGGFRCAVIRARVPCLRMVHCGHGHPVMLAHLVARVQACILAILRHAMGQRHQRRKHQCGSKKQVHHQA